MKIYIRSAQKLSPEQQVNRIGKYLSKHLDGVYKTRRGPNTYDIYVHFEYQDFPEYTESPPVHKHDILIMLTAYNNKVRVDTIELTEKEKTLGFDTFSSELFNDLKQGMLLVLQAVKKNVAKQYPGDIAYGF